MTKTQTLVHKAEPQIVNAAVSTCRTCGHQVVRVPGGQGPTYVHADTGAVAGPGAPRVTVDFDRPITHEEFQALVAIEVTERLAVKVHNLLSKEGDFTEADRLTATSLLESLVDVTTSRMATAVKQQGISDLISRTARDRVNSITEDTERRVAEATAEKEA